MHTAVLIYPHQLVPPSHPIFKASTTVYLAEEPLFLTEFPTHRSKLLLHRLSLQSYTHELRAAGLTVHYLDVRTHPSSESIWISLRNDEITNIHLYDVTDDWLTQRIFKNAAAHGVTLTWHPSPLFLLTKDDAIARYQKSRKHMARFYEQLRKDRDILMNNDGTPVGGRFSFDADNRKRLPKTVPLPADPTPYTNNAVAEAEAWLKEVPGEHYGEATPWLPYDREGARALLTTFLEERFAQFGPYEDAITIRGARVFHSTLSPLLNIGLLSPQEVLVATLTHAKKHNTPLPSLEGFVRQLIGWREFIRAAYELDGRTMRSKNFFDHTAPLPRGMWDATTGIPPLDHTITTALRLGYTHHIERLMVVGNYLLLTETNPHEVYRWFMAMYVDAYDWVMVPNVYGMSQFADGGGFATKPYMSGSSYLTKMSDHPKGQWETIWTALYWRFIDRHRPIFLSNHRLSMMPKLFDKLPAERRAHHLKTASSHLSALR